MPSSRSRLRPSRPATILLGLFAASSLHAQTGSPTSSQNLGPRPIGPNIQPVVGTAGVTLFSYGTTAGDTAVAKSDDDYTNIGSSNLRGAGPEGSTLVMTIGGTTYQNVYVNVNGLISFGGTLSSYVPAAFPYAGAPPTLAPYWADVDLRGGTTTLPSGNVWYRTTTDAAQLAAIAARIESAYVGLQNFTPTYAQIVTWDKVGSYPQDNTYVNTFQAVIASNGIETYTIYLYPKDGIWWTRGSASGGVYPSVGYDLGDGEAYNLPGSLTTGVLDLWFGTNTADGQLGTYVFDIGGELPAITVNGAYTATGTATPELTFAANSGGHTVTGATAADSITFNRLRFDDPANTATFTGQVRALAIGADAINEGNITFAGGSVLVAYTAGSLNGGNLTLADSAKLAIYAPNATTGSTSIAFTSTGARVDLRGFGTTLGTLNSAVSGYGRITNSLTTPVTLILDPATDGYYRGTLENGVGGVVSVVKNGDATQVLAGANTYTGTTTINAGALQFATPSSRPSGAITVKPGGTFGVSLGGAGEFTIAGVPALFSTISFAAGSMLGVDSTNASGGTASYSSFASLLPAGIGFNHLGGTLLLDAAQPASASFAISSGTVRVTNLNYINNAAALILRGGTLDLAGNSASFGSLAGATGIALGAGSLTVGADNTSTVFSGGLSGTGTFTKTGAGTLTYTGNSALTGAIAVTGGTFQIGDGGTTGSVSGDIANSATVTFNRSDALTYSGVISGSGTVTKIGANTLTLSGANTYTGATTVSAGTLALGAANRIADTSALVVASGATFHLAGFTETVGSLAGSGNVTLGSGGALGVGDDNISTIFSGTISGFGSLTKTGTGTLTLSGSNTYVGGTVLSAGAVELGSSAAIGATGTISFTGGTLRYSAANTSDYSARFSSAAGQAYRIDTNGQNVTLADNLTSSGGSLTKLGAGTLTLSGANTFSGATTISAGTLALGAANRLADTSALVVASGATFNLAGFSETIASLSGSGNVTLGSGTLTAGGDNASTTFSGVISGSGGLTKSGSGTLTLSGDNTFSGTTTISAGTLQIGAASTTGTLTGNIVNNAALTFNRSDSTNFAGAIFGTGTLTQLGAGTLTLSGANTYTGATTVSAGTLALGASDRLADTSALVVASGATFHLANFSESLGALSGSGNVTLGSGTLTAGGDNASSSFSGVISGSGGFTKSGTGTLTLSGDNTFSGATTISAGMLQIGAGSTSGWLLGNIVNKAALTFNRSDSVTFAGAISGTGTLTKLGAGTLTLSGANTYTGTTTISTGTLALGASDRLADTSALVVASGATFHLADFSESLGSLSGSGNVTLGSGTLTAGGYNASSTFAGVISGSGSFTKTGTGTLTLSGDNTYTGATTVSAGTLALGAANRVADTSALTVASGATFSLAGFNEVIGSLGGAGNVTLGSASLTAGGDNSTTTFSGVISGTGSLTKLGAGTLTLSGVNTYAGATTISGGTLALGAANRIADTSALTVASGATFNLANFAETVSSLAGSGNVTLGTGTLAVGGDNTSTTFSGVISGTGSLTKSGVGTFTLTGANTYAGRTTISGGTLQIGDGGTSGSIAGNLLNNAAVVFNRSDDFTYAGAISGTGSLTKLGAGTLILDNASNSIASLRVSAGTVFDSPGGTMTAGAVTVDADASLYLWNASLGSLAGAGYVEFDHTGVIGLDNTSTTFSGVLFNLGASVTKRGTGTLTLAGDNTLPSYYAPGAFIVEAGAVRLDHASALAGQTATLSGGTLEFGSVTNATIGGIGGAGNLNLTNRDGAAVTLTVLPSGNISSPNFTYSGALTGAGSLTFTGPVGSTLTLSGANTQASGTTLGGAARIILSGAGTLGASTAPLTFTANAMLSLNGTSQTVGTLSGSAGRIGNDGATASTLSVTEGNFGGTLSDRVLSAATGTLALVKAGTGTLILSGANTYTGGTTLSGGTLQIGAGGTTGSIVGDILNNATLSFNRSDAVTFAGAIAGTGSLTKLGAGTLTLSGANTFTGGTIVSAGALQIGSGGSTGSLAGNVALAAGTTLALNRSDDSSYAGVVSGDGSLTKSGSGVLTLSGNHTYTGGTVIDAGSLIVAFTGEKGTFATGSTVTVNAAGTLVVNGDSLGWGNLASKLVINGGTVTSSSTTGLHTTLRDVTMTGGTLTTSGSGRFLLNGPLTTLASASTATIATRLELLDNASTPTAFNIAAGSSTNGVDFAVTGSVHGTGALVKNGAGTLLLTGANTYTGATTVSAGTLRVIGSLANTAVTVASGAYLGGSGSIGGLTTIQSGAILAPGNSPGTITFTNGLALQSGSILDFELGSTSDLIRVTGGTLSGPSSGSITVNISDSGSFSAGVYTLIDATGASLSSIGATTFSLGSSVAGYTYAFSQQGSSFLLTASAIPEPSTFAALAGLGALALAATRRRRRVN